MTITQMANMNFSYRNMYVNQMSATKSLRNLSSGYRINSAADDAAGLAVSEKMRGQITGLSKAYTNTQNAISLVQTAEGNLIESSDILTRMKEITVQASNGTYTDEQRQLLNKEMTALKSELNRISGSSNYNGINLLDGSLGGKQGEAGMLSLGVTGVSTAAT
ncbi:MAG: flagellin, partial [Oscillospiraceae bacterium]|nr:flagellin [Oscillospiraceae bacterium]